MLQDDGHLHDIGSPVIYAHASEMPLLAANLAGQCSIFPL